MKRRQKKTFRDHDGYDVVNRHVRLRFVPKAQIAIDYESKETLGGYTYEDMQIDLREELADPQAVAAFFHEGGHDHLQNAGVERLMRDSLTVYNVPVKLTNALIELILDTLGQGWADVAHRNPEFWQSLSLKGD